MKAASSLANKISLNQKNHMRGPPKHSHFVVIDYHVLADLSLSWEAKGLHGYLLSRPDNWQISVAQLGKYGQAGRDKIYRMLNELIEHGYAARFVERDSAGRIVRREIIVHETKFHLFLKSRKKLFHLFLKNPIGFSLIG